MTTLPLDALREAFGERLGENEPLAKYTSARIGGPADALVVVQSADQLAEAAETLWALAVPFQVLGGGSNVLVSDAGVRAVTLLNKARQVVFDLESAPPRVRAESGSNFGAIARQAAQKGLTGLEWAAGIPGTLGGAVVGNAGAHGGDLAASLELAEVLHLTKGRQHWSAADLVFSYRSSALKREPGQAVVLAASLNLAVGEAQVIAAKMEDFLAHRRLTQPPGASMGSMFKNPVDDYAGRLIEQAGLKGARIGAAEISQLHGNFFLNHGAATAQDVYTLIHTAKQKVIEEFGIELELEIELIGDWNDVG